MYLKSFASNNAIKKIFSIFSNDPVYLLKINVSNKFKKNTILRFLSNLSCDCNFFAVLLINMIIRVYAGSSWNDKKNILY